ncbi:hypothetical protein J3B02_006415, partial [Coemansia erecta]
SNSAAQSATANKSIIDNAKTTAEDKKTKRLSYCSYSSETTAVEEDQSATLPTVPDETFELAASKPTPVVKCDELAAENQNAASEADAEAKAESTIDYCAALSSCRKDMVKTEGLYIVAYGSGPFWKLKESSALRADTFDWLSRITALNNLDIKLLHLAVQYLDHFLTDFDQQIEVDHLR